MNFELKGCLNTDIRKRNCVYFIYSHAYDGTVFFEWYSNYDYTVYSTYNADKISKILNGITKYAEKVEFHPNKSVEIENMELG